MIKAGCEGLGRRANGGFTIIELMVVTAMMSVLAMAVLPLAEITSTRTKERELRAALWEIRTAIDRYKRLSDDAMAGRPRSGSGYPPTLASLLEGPPDRSLTSGSSPRPLLRRIPRDPFAPDGVLPEQSWGLRSYDSPGHAPRAGADVYDVYSLSTRVGSNGIELRQW